MPMLVHAPDLVGNNGMEDGRRPSDLGVGGRLSLLPADPRPQLTVQRLLQQLGRRRRWRHRRRRCTPNAAAAAGNAGVADGPGIENVK